MKPASPQTKDENSGWGMYGGGSHNNQSCVPICAYAVAELKAEAARIESESELECQTQAREAEVAFLREQNQLEVTKAAALSSVEVGARIYNIQGGFQNFGEGGYIPPPPPPTHTHTHYLCVSHIVGCDLYMFVFSSGCYCDNHVIMSAYVFLRCFLNICLAYTYLLYACLYLHLYNNVHACACMCLHVLTCACLHVLACAYLHVLACACMHILTFMR